MLCNRALGTFELLTVSATHSLPCIEMTDTHPPITVGRYLLHRKIARGGMATIHIARLMGDVGFSRIVAAKRMHPDLAQDSEFVAMFLDEARIASKIHHRNVVPVLDVVTMGDELVLVQDYVHGAPLSLLLRTSFEANTHVPVPVAATIACHVLAGLHAAHETVDEIGTALHIVHRDVSPQNIMIATDGSARLLDFGVAKASVAAHVTRQGTFKGKLSYSSPEQIRGNANKQSDIYALGVVLWELLVGSRLHPTSRGEAEIISEIMAGNQPTVTEALQEQKSWVGSYRWSQLEALEPIIRKALDTNYRRRWATAADMEEAIAAAVPLAPAGDVASWLRAVGKDFLEARETMIAEEEASWRRTLAMTAHAVPLPTESLPVVAPPRPAQMSTAVATEPEAMPALTPSLGAMLRRGPTAMVAALVIVLAAAVAFLMRDLDATRQTAGVPMPAKVAPASALPEPATSHAMPTTPTYASPTEPAYTTVSPATHPVAVPAPVPSEVRFHTPMQLPDDGADGRDNDRGARDEPKRLRRRSSR